MTVIKQDDLIQSVADALQFISYYHPVDFIQAMHEAYLREESPAARDSMAQILINSRMCATGHRPICQDTGIVTVFVRVGMDVRWDGATMSLDDMINEGVRRAYNLPENVRKCIDDASGDNLVPKFADWWNKWDDAGKAEAEAAGHRITVVSEEERARWREALAPMLTKYLEIAKTEGVSDPDALYKAFQDKVAEYEAAHPAK